MLSELKQGKPFAIPQQELYLSLSRTVDKLRRQTEVVLKTRGLSEAQYNVLRILKGCAPECMSCGEIGSRMVTRDPDVTRLLDRLEQAGFAERKRGVPDRRIVTACITPQGIELVDALEGPLIELNQKQLGFLKEEELATLLDQLSRIRQHAT
jgi:DNA-binding MarR family transcriptional regulator